MFWLLIFGSFTLGVIVITVLRSLNLVELWRTTTVGLIRRLFTRLFIFLSIFIGVFLITRSSFFVLFFILYESLGGNLLTGIIAWILILLAPLITLIITIFWLRLLWKKSNYIEQCRKKEK